MCERRGEMREGGGEWWVRMSKDSSSSRTLGRGV